MANAMTKEEIYKRMEKWVVCVVAQRDSTSSEESGGTAFVLNQNGQFLTCRHVVYAENAANPHAFISVKRQDGQMLKVSVVPDTDSVALDIVVLQVQASDMETFNSWFEARSFATWDTSDALQEMNDCYTLGCPNGIFIPSHGHILRLHYNVPGRQTEFIVFSNPNIEPGSSGSPLCNNQGNVVGVVCAVRLNAQIASQLGAEVTAPNFSFAVTSRAIMDFLKLKGVLFLLDADADIDRLTAAHPREWLQVLEKTFNSRLADLADQIVITNRQLQTLLPELTKNREKEFEGYTNEYERASKFIRWLGTQYPKVIRRVISVLESCEDTVHANLIKTEIYDRAVIEFTRIIRHR